MSDIIYCSDPFVYTGKDLIGHGTYGNVYKDKNNNAVKIYNTLTRISDYGFNSSMIKELSSISLLQSDHNFVPRIFAIYLGSTSIEKHGFSMKKYDGTVETLIRNKLFDAKKIKNVIYSITLCLAHAQKNLLLHRDIKPTNILMDDNYNVSVTDWGMSLVKYSDYATKNTSIVQTLWYRSPEHLLHNVDEMNNDTIDMWSVGIMMIEMITNCIGVISENLEKPMLLKLIKYLGFPKINTIMLTI
jgi:serine/threonine protein kinase